MTEKEKMQAGEWFSPNDEELVRDRARARHLTHRLNVALKDKDATYLATLRELCPRVEAMIRAPFHCDYGYNISIGKGSYVNFNCVFLDLGPIRLGQRCLIGPGNRRINPLLPKIFRGNRATASSTTRCPSIKNCFRGFIYSYFFVTLHVGKIRRRLPARNRRHTANSGAAEYDKDR